MCANFANLFKGCGSPNTKIFFVKIGRGGRVYSIVKFLAFSYISWSYFYDLLHKNKAKFGMKTQCLDPYFVVCGLQTTKTMGRAMLKHNGSRVYHEIVLATIDIYLTPRVFLIMGSKLDLLR